jgi:hypothetical protein
MAVWAGGVNMVIGGSPAMVDEQNVKMTPARAKAFWEVGRTI